MAIRLSPDQHQTVRDYFTDAELLAQEEVGNLTIEDLQAIFAIPTDETIMTVDVVVNAIDTATDTITGSLNDYIATGTEYTGSALDDFGQLFRESVDDRFGVVADMVANLESSIYSYIDGRYSDVTQTYEALSAEILGIPIAQAQIVEETANRQTNTLLDYFMRANAIVLDAQVQTSEAVLFEIVPLVEAVAEVADSVVDQATGFATALRDTLPDLASSITDGLDSLGEAITDGLGSALTGVLNGLGLGFLTPFLEGMGKIGIEDAGDVFGSPPGPDLVGEEASLYINRHWPVILQSALPFIGTLAQIIWAGIFERVKQDSMGENEAGLLPASAYASALRRGLTTPEAAAQNYFRTGLSSEDVAVLMSSQNILPDMPSLVRWNARDMISPEEAERRAVDIGYLPGSFSNYKEEFYGPPPIGDLIRMVVRDVFDPDVVREGDLRADIDTFPFETAEQVGLTREWAERYWMAHWELPSLQQGFEMLHRGEIDDAGLEALFKAADLAPGYWEPMKAIAYRPFTRVDVRRMYGFGQLDRAGVLRSYKDIGYDDDKAELLTQFTVDYVDAQTKVTRAKERDLTKSDIIGLFNDGITNAQETTAYLIQLGYSDDEATVLVKREEIQEERKERKADIGAIIDQAKIKVLSFDQAQDQLAALDLSPTETKKAIAGLVRAIEARTRTPSKADLDNWLTLGLLTQVSYEEEMQALGYPDRYIAFYIEAMQAETQDDILAAEVREAGRREPRIATKGQLDSLYIAEIISDEEYQGGLANLGYRPGDVANFLIQATLKLEERLQSERDRIARGEVAPVRERVPNRTLLGKMFIKGLIGIDAYEQGLIRLGFSPDNVELLKRLISDKVASEEVEV